MTLTEIFAHPCKRMIWVQTNLNGILSNKIVEQYWGNSYDKSCTDKYKSGCAAAQPEELLWSSKGDWNTELYAVVQLVCKLRHERHPGLLPVCGSTGR